mgnify:CR=1 FL=1
MRKIFLVFALQLWLTTQYGILAQSPLDVYASHSKGETDYEIELVTEETILVSTEKPLVIRSPSKKEPFKVYMFTKIWDNEKFRAFVLVSDDPFEPRLVTTSKEQIEIDKIQLLGNYGKNRADFEAIEEVKISSDQDIVLTAKLHTWKLDKKGERIKKSEKVSIKTDKYRIDDSGQLKKII